MKGDLQRFSRAVSALHDCRSPDGFGEAMLGAMRALCDADNFTVNSMGPDQLGIYASTIDYSCEQMEIFNAFLPQHPLIEVIQGASSWSEYTTLRQFRQTAHYHDFFRLIETRYQLGGALQVGSGVTIGLSFNRARHDFREEDARLLFPHVRVVIGGEAVAVVDEQAFCFSQRIEPGGSFGISFPLLRAATFPLELQNWLRRNPAASERFLQVHEGRRPCLHMRQCHFLAHSEAGGFCFASTPTAVRCLRFAEQRRRSSDVPLCKSWA